MISPLNDEQFNALRKSLPKWQYLAYHNKPVGEPFCACCTYDSKVGEGDCSICPIHQTTNKRACVGTPYTEWSFAIGCKATFADPKIQTLAEEEYLFLEGIYSIELHRRLAVEHNQRSPL